MTLNRLLASTIIAASAFAGLGYMASEAGASPARDDSSSDVYAWEVGDDNQDGVIDEDESGWDCATMGNMICGPR